MLTARCTALFAAMLVCHTARAQVIPCSYEVITFDGPMCGSGNPAPIVVNGINDTDPPTVVGYWFCPPLGNENGFYWNEKEGLVTLTPPPGYSQVRAEDVNDNMQIVGSMVSGATRGFVYQDGAWTILPPLPGGTHAGAFANNNNNVVTGYRDGPGDKSYPFYRNGFVWDAGVFISIPPSYTNTCIPLDINDDRIVVGRLGNLGTHAFMWKAGRLFDLTVPPNTTNATARAINSSNEILTTASFEGNTVSFVWDEVWTQLPLPIGCTQAIVRDYNDSRAGIGSACGLPYLWQNGTVTKVTDLLPNDVNILAPSLWVISDGGHIAGIASKSIAPFNIVGTVLKPVFAMSGDSDCDEDVDVDDLLTVINAWSEAGGFADLNGDGIVNAIDLVIVIENWT